MNNIITVKIGQLVPADWNYKKDDEAVAKKLMKSIEHDKSAGVPAVRVLGKKYEVIDGNHRLKALQILGWKELMVENFGKISKAKAIMVAKRRNTLWFEDDVLKFADLFKNDVIKEYGLKELEGMMPNSLEELADLSKMSDFNWSQYDNRGPEADGWKGLSIKLSESQYKVVRRALDKVIKDEGLKNNPDGMALEYICADYLA